MGSGVCGSVSTTQHGPSSKKQNPDWESLEIIIVMKTHSLLSVYDMPIYYLTFPTSPDNQ